MGESPSRLVDAFVGPLRDPMSFADRCSGFALSSKFHLLLLALDAPNERIPQAKCEERQWPNSVQEKAQSRFHEHSLGSPCDFIKLPLQNVGVHEALDYR